MAMGSAPMASTRSRTRLALQANLASAAVVRDTHYLRCMVHGILSCFEDAMTVGCQFDAEPFFPLVSHDALNATCQIAIFLRKIFMLGRRKSGS